MTRTPDDVKKGLLYCGAGNHCKGYCPYDRRSASIEGCTSRLSRDAYALIQQLQDDNAEKDKRIRELERSLSFACDLSDGLKAATVKQEQELYVSVERNRQLEATVSEKDKVVAELSGEIGQLEADNKLLQDAVDQWELVAASPGAVEDMARENTELLEKVEQLQAERDAAVADVALFPDCSTCKYDPRKKGYIPNDCDDCIEHCNYKWRGVQKEE